MGTSIGAAQDNHQYPQNVRTLISRTVAGSDRLFGVVDAPGVGGRLFPVGHAIVAHDARHP